jgi:hypothetical protein
MIDRFHGVNHSNKALGSHPYGSLGPGASNVRDPLDDNRLLIFLPDTSLAL